MEPSEPQERLQLAVQWVELEPAALWVALALLVLEAQWVALEPLELAARLVVQEPEGTWGTISPIPIHFEPLLLTMTDLICLGSACWDW